MRVECQPAFNGSALLDSPFYVNVLQDPGAHLTASKYPADERSRGNGAGDLLTRAVAHDIGCSVHRLIGGPRDGRVVDACTGPATARNASSVQGTRLARSAQKRYGEESTGQQCRCPPENAERREDAELEFEPKKSATTQRVSASIAVNAPR